MWFITKVKYNKTNEEGLLKAVSEQYLVDSYTFTEAETRIYEQLEKLVVGDFDVTDISKTNYTDVFYYEGSDYWYKCKVQYVITDENTGKEKKITLYMLVEANTVKEAYERIHVELKTMTIDFTVADVIETKIIDVFNYKGL